MTDPVGSDPLSEAIVVWTGKGTRPWPQRDDNAVAAAFGQDVAERLLPVIRRLELEFFRLDCVHHIRDLTAATHAAAAEFAARHPELSPAAVDALAWCYSYDWR